MMRGLNSLQEYSFGSFGRQSQASELPQEIYAEWVGAQAKLALLEAHAHCRTFAAGLPDEVTHKLVTVAQATRERCAYVLKLHCAKHGVVAIGLGVTHRQEGEQRPCRILSAGAACWLNPLDQRRGCPCFPLAAYHAMQTSNVQESDFDSCLRSCLSLQTQYIEF